MSSFYFACGGVKYLPTLAFFVDEFWMQSNSAFAFQKPHYMGYAVFRRKTQAHMHVVHHCMTLDKPDTTLSAQITNNLSKPVPNSPVKHFLAIFWEPN